MLGTPSREEIHAMNPNYTEFKFPQIKRHPWTRVFTRRMPTDAIDLVRVDFLVAAGPERSCVTQSCYQPWQLSQALPAGVEAAAVLSTDTVHCPGGNGTPLL